MTRKNMILLPTAVVQICSRISTMLSEDSVQEQEQALTSDDDSNSANDDFDGFNTVKHLLCNNDFRIQDKFGRTKLFKACEKGNL